MLLIEKFARLRHWLIAALAFFLPPGTTAQLSKEQNEVLVAIARHQQLPAWPEISGAQARALHTKAEAYFSNYQKYHQPFGLTADILFSDRTRLKVEKLEGIGDAATWTGHYLAALACRYSFGHEGSTLMEISRVLDTFETLTEVTGKKGFIARFAGPSNDPAYKRYYSVYGDGPDPDRPGFGHWAYRGAGRHSDKVWLGYPSRDVYIGVNLGLATAFRLVPDVKIHKRLTALVESIIDRLMQDSWIIVDDAGHKYRWQPTPSMQAALLRTGASVNPAKYLKLYEEKAAPILSVPAPDLCKYCSYYPNNLEFADFYVLTTLETDPLRRANYENKMKEMWQQCADHLNAWFAAAYVSAVGKSSPIARATVQGCLVDFPALPRWDKAVDYSMRTDLPFEILIGTKWARYALPVAERVRADFLWQRSPFQLAGGSDQPLEYPGLDLLLPYYMGCQCGLIPLPEKP